MSEKVLKAVVAEFKSLFRGVHVYNLSAQVRLATMIMSYIDNGFWRPSLAWLLQRSCVIWSAGGGALPIFCRAVVEAGLAPRAAGDMLAVKVKRHARPVDSRCGYLLMLWENEQLRLDSGSSPAGWFPLPDAVAEAFGLPPICPSIVRLRCPLSSFGSRWTVVRIDMR